MVKYRKNKNQRQFKIGKGLGSDFLFKLVPIRSKIISHTINNATENLPFEAHLPGYQYCGPGTHLQERIKRGDAGINRLDKACKRHDIVYDYSRPNDIFRKSADVDLLKEAFAIVSSKDASFGERCAALAVLSAMVVKSL